MNKPATIGDILFAMFVLQSTIFSVAYNESLFLFSAFMAIVTLILKEREANNK